jgi:uncharacterized protein (TIGR02594 family)
MSPPAISSPRAPDIPKSPKASGVPKMPDRPDNPTVENETSGLGRSNSRKISSETSNTNTPGSDDQSNQQQIMVRQKSSTQGKQAMQVARQEIGVKEQPKGSNRGPRVDEYQGSKKGQYWCAHFVSWCIEQTGTSPFGHVASVATIRRWGQRNGKYSSVDNATPEAGDIFTKARRDDAGKIVGGHIGFVQSYDAKNKNIFTVEGNSGDAVQERTRNTSTLDGFIRI